MRVPVLRAVLILISGFVVSFSRFFEYAPRYFQQRTRGDGGSVSSRRSVAANSPRVVKPSKIDLTFKEPADYLNNLTSADPATVPPDVRPICVAINNACRGMADVDSEERDARNRLDMSFEELVESAQGPGDFNQMRSEIEQAKEICRKRQDYYREVQPSIQHQLHRAGLSAELAANVSALFVERTAVVSCLKKSEQVSKNCDDALELLRSLEEAKANWWRDGSGEIVFSDDSLLTRFRRAFPDVPAGATPKCAVLSPAEYAQRCHEILEMAGKNLPGSGDPSFEAVCDTRILEQLFNGLSIEVAVDADWVTRGMTDLLTVYRDPRNYGSSAGSLKGEEIVKVFRFAILFELAAEELIRQDLADIPSAETKTQAYRLLASMRNDLGVRYKYAVSALKGESGAIVSRRRMAFLLLETLSRAKSFVDSTVLRSLTEIWEKEKDPIVRRVLELALKEWSRDCLADPEATSGSGTLRLTVGRPVLPTTMSI